MITFLFSCVLLQAETQVKEYKLKDGKVLINPIVLEQEPDGLSVGHQNGVIFVKFSDLPESIQKKYNYNPKAAETHTIKKQQSQIKHAQQAHQDKISKQKKSVETELSRQSTDIDKLKLRIQYLTKKISSLNQAQDKNKDRLTQLALDRPTTRVDVRDNYYWRGGYHVTVNDTSSSRERRNLKKLRKSTEEQIDSDKAEIDNLKDEIVRRNNQLQIKQKEHRELQEFYSKNFK